MISYRWIRHRAERVLACHVKKRARDLKCYACGFGWPCPLLVSARDVMILLSTRDKKLKRAREKTEKSRQ